MASLLLSRKLYQSLLSNPRNPRRFLSLPFSSNFSSDTDSDDLSSELGLPESDPSPSPQSSAGPTQQQQQQQGQGYLGDRPLENGLDVGIYKAILVGQVGQNPIQKKLKGGRVVTLLSVGTGGIRNNRRPLDNEEPKDYANRCSVQWHRVSIYPERLGDVAMKHVTRGSILYLEGNLETKIFSDPVSGLVRRIREVAVRKNGRLVHLGNGSESQKSTPAEIKGVGYF